MEFTLFTVKVKRYDSDKERILYFHSQRELKKAIMPIEKHYVNIWQLCQFVCKKTCQLSLSEPPTETLFQETNEIVKEIRTEYESEREVRNGVFDDDLGLDEVSQDDLVIKQDKTNTYIDEELDNMFNYD